MPEVTPEKNLEIYRQCEIRRPSLPAILHIVQPGIGEMMITKPAGHYVDVVWVKNDLAQKGKKIVDGRGNEWTITELYGTKPMAGSREGFKSST